MATASRQCEGTREHPLKLEVSLVDGPFPMILAPDIERHQQTTMLREVIVEWCSIWCEAIREQRNGWSVVTRHR